MKKFQHSLVIGADTWHGRWYRYWLSLGGKQPKYRENLCHYVRVLLIWAPLRWFFKARVVGWLQPWLGALFVVLVAAVAALFTFKTQESLEGLLVVGVVVGIIVLGVVGANVGIYLDNNYDMEKRVKRFWKKFGSRVWSKIVGYAEATIKWFFTRSYIVKGLAPVTVCIIAGFTVLGILATPIFVVILLAILGTLALVTVIFGTIWSLLELNDYGKLDRLKKMWPWFKRFVEGTSDTVKLGVTYANTKKQGSLICPFIDLPDSETEPNS
jgi:hypothetical protein